MSDSVPPTRSPWPWRWSLLLVCLTFPLLWVGGLITSTGAGMAVPDWPNTYGYNMFLYPWKSWVLGPWDLLIEHGHRLFASLVGLVAIGLVIVAAKFDRRRWFTRLAIAALLLVIAQGALGGLRVVYNSLPIAMIHGVVGPTFFTFVACIAATSSQRWQSGLQPGEETPSKHFSRLLWFAAAVAWVQLTLGASMRHVPEMGRPWSFALHVQSHLTLATVLLLVLFTAAIATYRGSLVSTPRGLIRLCAVLILLQFSLGLGTWVMKYALPGWAEGWWPARMEAIRAGGWLQTHVATAHSALGSLILALTTVAALFVSRLRWTAAAPTSSSPAL